MTSFDAELYLRLAGEKRLLDGRDHNRGPWDSPITEAARALIAVAAIDADRTQAVIDDYDLAMALRGEDQMQHRRMRGHTQQPAPEDARPIEPCRVVSCDRVIDQPNGTMHIRYVSLSKSATSVAVTFHPNQRRSRRARRGATRMMAMGGGPFGGGGPSQVTLTDDRATTVSAHFSGGGSDQEWRGHLHAHPPLAEDTAWIEVDGERIDLIDEELGVEVSVEQLPDEDPAWRHLWRLAAIPDRFHRSPESLAPAIEALVAARALSADDPALDDLRAVVEALQHGNPSSSPTTNRLPEPWRSLLARRSLETGPTGTIVIGAFTPLLDGVSVGVIGLEASETGFTLEVEATPGLGAGMPFESSLQQQQLAWWAADDRGNHYLGQMGGWSGGDGHAQGEINYWPALDPKATRLDLMPTAETSRAVIRVPLSWTDSKEQDT